MCVSGVTGANLKRRLEGILANRAVHRLSRGRKLLLAAAGIVAVAGPAGLGVLIGVGQAPPVRAQTALGHQRFRLIAMLFDLGAMTPDHWFQKLEISPAGSATTASQLSRLECAANLLGALPEKKLLIYFSGGAQNAVRIDGHQLRKVVRTARQSNLDFYPVDASGAVSRNQRQLQVIDYLREENRVLREPLGGRRLNDDQRR